MICEFEHKIFEVREPGFEALALDIFQVQVRQNPVYREYAELLNIRPEAVRSLCAIPFLPISFFKTHAITTGSFEPAAVFESSGTTRTGNSRHFVKDLSLYRKSFSKAFERFYGPVKEWCILGLLPSYLERQHSSLVVMTDELIRASGHPASGFYLYEYDKLRDTLLSLEREGQKTLLIGVSFALLDFAERCPLPLRHTTVMETGGMKGRRKEITRTELHGILKDAWQLAAIHSEYGMTELLSQAYAMENGRFECPPWMKVLPRREDDPLEVLASGEGILNIIDLANIYSCSFIATDDIGRVEAAGSFEVSGRLDNSDLRGCSLMLAAL